MEIRFATAASPEDMCDRSSEHRIVAVHRPVSDVPHGCQSKSAAHFLPSSVRLEHTGREGDVAPQFSQFSTLVSTLEDVLKTPIPATTNSAKKQRNSRRQKQTQSGTMSEQSGDKLLSNSAGKSGKQQRAGSVDSKEKAIATEAESSSVEKRRRKRRTDTTASSEGRPVNGAKHMARDQPSNARKQSRVDRLAAASQSKSALSADNGTIQQRLASVCTQQSAIDELPDDAEAAVHDQLRVASRNVGATRETRYVQTEASGVQVQELISAVESTTHMAIFARPRTMSVSRTEQTSCTPVLSLFDSSSSSWMSGTGTGTGVCVPTSTALLSTASSITQTMDTRIEALQCEIVRLKSEKEQLGRELMRHETLQPEAVKLLQELLLQKSDLEKEQLRERCSLNKYRLGEFQYLRQGSALVEQLTEGVSFQKIRKRRSEIAAELNEVEKRRRSIVKMSRDKQKQQQAATAGESQTVPVPVPAGTGAAGATVSVATSSSTCCSLEELVERDEIFKLRTAALRKEDAELQRELERLSRDRLVHSKQLKRIEAEDASRFLSTLERPRVLNDRYLLLELIGKGGFSEVHRAYDLVAMRYVACKIHEHNAAWSREYRDSYVRHVVREIEIQKTLCHPRIVSIYDAFDIDANALCTVLEHVHGHDLDFHLRQHQLIVEREARAIVLQIVAALVYLNEQNPAIIHYDLKPANILLSLEPQANTNTFSIKITDFGLAKLVQRRNGTRNNPDDGDAESDATSASGTELTSQGVGTYWYLPPECFFGIGPNACTPFDDDGTPQSIVRISNKVDVWSLGVVFYNMMYGCKPFGHGVSQQEILRTNLIVTKGRDVTFPAKPHVSLDARRFIMRCLTYEKELRPDVFAIAKDSYLQRDFTTRKRNATSRRNAKDSQSTGCRLPQSVNNVQRIGVANVDDAELQDERDETAAGESDEQDADEERDEAETA